MYKNKLVIEEKPRNNIAGLTVSRLRKERGWSQNDLAIQLQNIGHDIHKNGVQKMECGERFITDIELIALSKVFNTTVNDLLGDEPSVMQIYEISHSKR